MMVATLEQLPHEVLTHIAYYVALTPQGPPSDLLLLLCASRTLYNHLAPGINTALYARLFAGVFDRAAIVRRLGMPSPTQLTEELQYRFAVLKRLRRYVELYEADPTQGALDAAHACAQDCLCQDLWKAYVMALEHDEHNVRQLYWAKISAYTDIHAVQTMCAHHVHRTYPTQAQVTALAMHLRHMLSRGQQLSPTDDDSSDEQDSLFLLLKPFVFAAHEYDMFFGPWTARTLPLSSAHGGGGGSMPYASVRHCGTTLTLAVPPVSQAATSLMFQCTAHAMPTVHLTARLDKRIGSVPTRLQSSRDYDHDFRRLQLCYDARSAPGLRLEDHIGRLSGVWEGRFSFFDMDAYREMLDGSTSALYDGTFGEQTQVLRLSEAVVCMSSDGVARYHEEIMANDTFSHHIAQAHKSAEAHALPAPTRSGSQQPYITASHGEVMPPTDAATMLQEWRKLPFWCDDEAPADGDQRELLLYGTGHSAWGKFFVRGRVRAWDGLVVLLKEYGPGRQGKWMYRGYSLAGSTMVGRWRDAYTPHALHGYEGPFILTRRS